MQWVTNAPKEISQMEIAAHWDGDVTAYNRWRSQFVEGEPKPSATVTAKIDVIPDGYGVSSRYRASFQ